MRARAVRITTSLAAVHRLVSVGTRWSRSATTSARPIPSPARHLVLGSGSNVMDLFYRVRALPAAGGKQYFSDETVLSDKVVGGVTLNHLAWAAVLGAPTGLLAKQGTDPYGLQIRSTMSQLGLTPRFVSVSPSHTTSVSHVFIDESGERSILMAPASTSTLVGSEMKRLFAHALPTASMVTTEISQLPLSGVEFLLEAARQYGLPSLLDLDVPPSVATGAARLGTADELRRCVTKTEVLKLTATAAQELLALVRPAESLSTGLDAVVRQLLEATGVRLCVITDGKRGSALAVRGPDGTVTSVHVPVFDGVVQKDATGAGDAFFGGVVASLFRWGYPRNDAELARMGKIASAAGAACCEVVGALPILGVSPERVAALEPAALPLLDTAKLIRSSLAAEESAAASASATNSTPSAASATGAKKDGGGSMPVDEAQFGFALPFFASLYEDVNTALRLFRDFRGDVQGGTGTRTAHVREFVRVLRAARVTTTVSNPGAASSSPSSSSSTTTSSSTPVPLTPTVYVTGIGKSAAVAGRFAASLRSIGVRASFVHGAEWVHGDLGTLATGDVVVALSHSGATAELVNLAREARGSRGATVWAIVGKSGSPLEAEAHGVVVAATGPELLGSVPTRSIVGQEMLCNALLSMIVHEERISVAEFKANHPGGAIGAAEKKPLLVKPKTA